MIDFEKIAKLLNLTKSENDNESLSAIRLANSILSKSNLDWHNIEMKIGKKINHKMDYPLAPISVDYEFVVSASYHGNFMNYLSDSQHDFIMSIANYAKDKTLSVKQYEVFTRIWNKFAQKAKRTK